MNWDLVANITTSLTSVTILVALIQFIREIRAQNLQSFFYLHQYLSQNDLAHARKVVRTELCRKDYAAWSDEDKEQASLVCSSYDQAGILLEAGVLDKKTRRTFLGSSWGRSIVDQYDALSAFLDDMQTPHQTGREFFRHFSALAAEARTYQKGK